MLKLKRYLKPFIIGLLLAIALLFAQAMFDLSLPNYMSDIVNVGIQQNGIEHAAPDAISADGLTFMKSFMTADEKSLANESYSLKKATDKNSSGKAYKDTYSAAPDELYIRNDLDEETLSQLDLAFGSATWTMINFMRESGGKGMAGQGSSGGTETPDLKSIDMREIYIIQPMLDQMPEAALSGAREKALSLDETTLRQSGTMLAGAFLTELGVDIGRYQSNYIYRVGGLMLLIALGSGLATILVSYISSRIAAGVAKNLRNDVFERIEHFSGEEFDRFSTASLITRSTNDVTQMQMLLMMGIRMVCYAPIMAVGGVIMALDKSVSMSWIIAVSCLVLIGLILIIFSVSLPKFKSMQKFIDRLNLVARETLNGLMVIRAFGTDRFEKERFETANRDLAKINLFVNRAMTYMFPIMMLIMNGTTVLVIWIGAHQVEAATMQVGDMMAFMQYAMQIIMSFLMISMMFIFIPRAAVSGQRISEVLDTKPTILDPKNPRHIDGGMKGKVEFKNVHFRYHGADEDALKDISFIAKPGETTAFIGATGSGKSTLINLIPRFYDATGGEVLVDGINVKELTQKELRSHIGLVPQKSVLMSGTIDSNIRYGNDAISEDEVKEMASVAQALDFIGEKEDGMGSEIAQGGTNVSGGQRQRLSIARALAVQPDIYIFDDSFSALDFKTDAALRQALKSKTKDATVLIVAQRVGTIMNADHIYVIEDGRIIGAGTHRELLKSCPTYYEIASSQLSKEELDNE